MSKKSCSVFFILSHYIRKVKTYWTYSIPLAYPFLSFPTFSYIKSAYFRLNRRKYPTPLTIRPTLPDIRPAHLPIRNQPDIPNPRWTATGIRNHQTAAWPDTTDIRPWPRPNIRLLCPSQSNSSRCIRWVHSILHYPTNNIQAYSYSSLHIIVFLCSYWQ